MELRVAVDTSGVALNRAIHAGPDLIKPNVEELAEATGRTPVTVGDVVEAAQHLRREGARVVLASLGADGAILVDGDGDGAVHGRPTGPLRHARHLPHRDRPPGHRPGRQGRGAQHLLQALGGRAVPERGPGDAYETVVNCPRELACNAGLPNLDELQDKARAINKRLLEARRVGQETVLASPAFERIAHPSVTSDGRRTPALRFGDPRVTALAGALAAASTVATGITSKSLRALITGLQHASYTPGQMTYDPRRLRLAGLLHRIEHTNRYVLTRTGSSSPSYTKPHNRLLRPSWPPTRHRHHPNSSTPPTR